MKLTSDKLFEEIGKIDPEIINSVEEMRIMNKNKRTRKIASFGAVAAAAALIALPNVNATVAEAAYGTPLLGQFFEVVTFRNYETNVGDTVIGAEVPRVDTGADKVSIELNKSVEEYTDMLIAKFTEETGGATGSIDISYDVVTDSDTWFTLKINATEAQASGYNTAVYYHVDKATGEIAELSDVFEDGTDYITAISDDITAQMTEQMAEDETITYVMDEFGFQQIADDQEFYFGEDGTLVISFDEYEVAPGYMGIVEFEIDNSVIAY